MSDMPKEDQEKLFKFGSVLIEKLSKDELRTLSLAHDCGYLDTIMDEVNQQVMEDFPEEFYGDLYPDNDEISRKNEG